MERLPSSTLTELDTQLLLSNLQAVVLALRSNPRIHRGGFTDFSLHPLMAKTLQLYEVLSHNVSYTNAVSMAPLTPHCNVFQYSFSMSATVPQLFSEPSPRKPGAAPSLDTLFGLTDSLTRGGSSTTLPPASDDLCETQILFPFCAVCVDSDVGEAIATVALSSLIAIVEGRCSFITEKGLTTIIQTALLACSDLKAQEGLQFHDIFLGRAASAYVACFQHPAASDLCEEVYVDAAKSLISISASTYSSALLKRVAEAALKTVVSLFFDRLTIQRVAVGDTLADKRKHSDGSYMVRLIASLISGEPSAALGADSEQGRRVTPGVSVSTFQLQGLWLAQQMLVELSGFLRQPPFHQVLEAVRQHLCRALLTTGVQTKHTVVLSLIMRTLHLLINAAAEHLVPQIYNFLRVLILQPLSTATEEMLLTSSPLSPTQASLLTSVTEFAERRTVALENLTYLCSHGPFWRYCYTNYDLSSQYAAVIPQLCEVLLYQACGRLDNRGSSSSLADSHLMAMQAALNLVRTLTEVYIFPIPGVATPHPVTAKVVDATIQHTITQKNLLVQFAALFADHAIKRGIPFLLEVATRVPRGSEKQTMVNEKQWIVIAEPAGGREVGECLFRLHTMLDKRLLGEYLGELGDFSTVKPEEDSLVEQPDGSQVSAFALWESRRGADELVVGTASFFNAQLEGFIHQLNLKGKPLLDSIRVLVYAVCLPGESQKIDRIMEMFANYWYDCNPPHEYPQLNPFNSNSTAFILSFAIILLNTDLHSGKLHQPMTLEDFLRMNRQVDEGQDIPASYLKDVYDDVKAHEIIMAEMINKCFTNEVTWRLEMREDSSAIEKMSPLCFWDVLERTGTEHLTADSPYWRNSVGLDGPSQQLLARYVFASVWRQSLLLFTGMVREMMQQLGAITGGDMTEMITSANNVAPVEFSTLLAGIRGVISVIVVSRQLNVPEVVDECYFCLLSIVLEKPSPLCPPDLPRLSRDLPRMLCIREVFHLLPQVSTSLRMETWLSLSQMVSSLFIAGALATNPEASGTHSLLHHSSPQPKEEGQGTAAAIESTSGGWLSSLWQSAISGKKARDSQEHLQAMSRMATCVPTIASFLECTALIPASAHNSFISALLEVNSTQLRLAAEVRTFSYMFSFVCTMVLQKSKEDPTYFQSSLCSIITRNLPDVYTMVQSKLPVDEENLQTAVVMCLADATRTPLDSPVLWLRVLRRISDGIFSLVTASVGSVDEKTIQTLFSAVTSSPSRAFPHLVAIPLLEVASTTLTNEKSKHNPYVRLLLDSVLVLHSEVDERIVERYATLVKSIAVNECYDPPQQVEELLEMILRIGLLVERGSRPPRSAVPLHLRSCLSTALLHCSTTIRQYISLQPTINQSQPLLTSNTWMLCLKVMGALIMRVTVGGEEVQQQPDIMCALEGALSSKTYPIDSVPLLQLVYKQLLLPLADQLSNTTADPSEPEEPMRAVDCTEVVVNRLFYNYFAEDLHPTGAILVRFLRFLPKPLMSFAGANEDAAAAGSAPSPTVLFNLWKQIIAIYHRMLQHSLGNSQTSRHTRSPDEMNAVSQSIYQALSSAISTIVSHGEQDLEAPATKCWLSQSRTDFCIITSEMLRLLPFPDLVLRLEEIHMKGSSSSSSLMPSRRASCEPPSPTDR